MLFFEVRLLVVHHYYIHIIIHIIYGDENDDKDDGIGVPREAGIILKEKKIYIYYIYIICIKYNINEKITILRVNNYDKKK